MATNSLRTLRIKLGALALSAAIVAAGCTAGSRGGDKAGGGGDTVVLRMALRDELSGDLGNGYFVRRVGELSGGTLRIEAIPGWGGTDPTAEQNIVRGVAKGKVDLGSVGTRVFDTLGVPNFQALTAPMLIDSYPLEQAVLASDIPSQMLQGLATLKVTGIAVFGDGLRKPIAVHGPLLGPADWRGITFAAFRSKAQAQAVQALGARPTDLWSTALTVALANGEVQGVENNLLVYRSAGRARSTPYVTANVNLWPRTEAILANPDRLSRLSGEQQGWIRQAAADAASRSTSLVENEDQIVTDLCQAGARFANASQADLNALHQAFAPVYVTLEQDPQTKSFVASIETLKRSTPAGAPLDIPPGCTGSASRGGPAEDPLAGSWTTAKITESQIVRAFVALGGSEKDGHQFFVSLGTGSRNYAVITLRFHDGSWEFFETAGDIPIHEDDGSYEFGNDGTVMLTSGSCTNTMRYDLSGDSLRLPVVKRCPAETLRPYGSTSLGSFSFTRSS